MLGTVLCRWATFVTLALVVVTELKLLPQSGTSSIICLIIGANVALVAGYCQACYLKASPRHHGHRRQQQHRTSSLVDTTQIFSFYKTIKQDSSSIYSFLISWIELLLQVSILCILLKVCVIILRVLTDSCHEIPEFFKDGLVSLPWNDDGLDVATCLLTILFSVITLLVMKVVDKLNLVTRLSSCLNNLRSVFNSVIICFFVAKLVAFIVLAQPYLDVNMTESWLVWNNTHPNGFSGVMSSTSACLLAYTLWSGPHTKDDHLRVSFSLPFMATFLLNVILLAVFGFLINFSEISTESNITSTSLFIFQIHKKEWPIVLLGSLDVVILSIATWTVFTPLICSIDLVTSKLGRSVRVDLTTIETKPKILRKFVWTLVMLITLIVQLLCNIDQLLAMAESFALFLASATFLMTIVRSYKITSRPQYTPLAQNESVADSTEGESLTDETNPMRTQKDAKSESSEESETDIDAIVEEYKNQLKVQTFDTIPELQETHEPNGRSFLIVKICVNISFTLTLILSIIVIHINSRTVIFGVGIAYILVSFFLYVLAIKQPRNDTFHPKLPLMPLVPLLCLNVCVFLQPFCLHIIWPAVMAVTFLGLLFHTFTTCLRQDQHDDSASGDDHHQHSICLQPLPRQMDHVHTTVLPAHSSRKAHRQRRHKHRQYSTTIINNLDPSVT